MTPEPQARDITRRQLLACAAGIGATASCYFDDAAAAGPVAPPAFCVALEAGLSDIILHGTLTWALAITHGLAVLAPQAL